MLRRTGNDSRLQDRRDDYAGLVPLGFADDFAALALAAGAAFALATNRPVAARSRAAAAADRDEPGLDATFAGFGVDFATAAVAAGFAAAGIGAALERGGADRVAGALDARVAGADAVEADAVEAGAVDAGADVAFGFTPAGRAAVGIASRAASAVVAFASWSRRFSSLARALAIALSRFTSASARRNDSLAAFFLPFFAMDMTLPA